VATKKIVLGVSSSFCANFLKGQIANLNKNDFEVVIISGPGEEIELLANKEKAKLYTVDFTKRFSVVKDFFILLKLIKILRSEKPDIINAGNPKSGFLIMIAALLVGAKNRIFTLHGLLSDTQMGVKKMIIANVERISCSIAKKIFVVSPSLLEHAVKRRILKREKSICLGMGSSNGVDINLFQKSSKTILQSIELKKTHDIKEDDFVIGFVGRISKDKGIEFLLDAFLEIKKKYVNCKLVLIGPYEDNNPISALHKSLLYNTTRGIYYWGKKTEVAPYYLLCNVLALTSYREGFGNVLIEAAAMEIPVIATNIPGCKDALGNGYNGLLYELGNQNDFVSKIEVFIKDNKLIDTYGKNGREFVIKNFINTTIWELQITQYKKMMNK
jgi:glycosyltransferase involved in cell wall biosynthesis